MIENRSKLLRKIDWTLLAVTCIIAVFGLVVIYGASYSTGGTFFRNQAIWFTLGLILMVFFASVSYKQYQHYVIIAYAVDILLLIIVLITSRATMGAQRWINIGFFKLQPSEFTKIIVIIALATYLAEKKGILSAKDIAVSFAIVAVPLLLIFRQPDLGTALVLLVIWLCLMLVAGIKLKHLAVILMIGLIIVTAVFQLGILKQYQVNRLLVFINPELDTLGSGYNLLQTKIAVGSGGFFGKGLLSGSQTNLSFIPEAHTDFIFAVLGEKTGFLGALFILGMYLLLITRGIRTSLVAEDHFGALVALAIVSMWLFQIFINIGMNIGIMPITGIPLPFLSYGGSSLWTNMISAGILLSIYSHSIK